MASGQNSNGGVKWTAMSTIVAALIAAIAAITVGYWQYFKNNELTREFRGRITDAETGKVLRQAKIVLEAQGSPPMIYSDSEGFFSFLLERANTQVRIRVEANGYEKYDRLINPTSGSGVEEIRVQPTRNSSPSPEPTDPVVKITQPTDGSQVPIEKDFAGTFSNLPENASLWLYVYPTDEHKYYLREIVDRRNDGTWQLRKVPFGTPANIGTTYRVGVLVADIESTRSLRSNSQGLSQLPNQKKYSERSINRQ